MDYIAEALNMLVGGPACDQREFFRLATEHIRGKRHFDPQQWRGWPALKFGRDGKYHYQGVW